MTNNKPQTSLYSWILLAIVILAGGISVYVQMAVAARAFELIPALKLNAVQFGMIMTAPMFPSIFLALPVGALADRYGVKIICTIGMIIAIAGTCFRYVSNDFIGYFSLMALTGTGVMCINANIGKIVAAWFSEEHSGRALGIYYAGIRFGMFIGMATGAMFASANSCYAAETVLMIIGTLAWMLFAKNAPAGYQAVSTEPLSKHFGVAMRSKNVWLAGVGALFFWGGFMAFNGNMANALNAINKIDPVTAGWVASMILLGNAFGNLLGPIFEGKAGLMKPFMHIATLGAILILFGWHGSITALWSILFLGGLLIGIALPFFMYYPVLLPEIPYESSGAAGGLVAQLMIIGAFCVPSWIIAPIAGMNFSMIFILGTVCFIIVNICSGLLPEIGAKAKKAEAAKTASQSA